MTTPFESSSSSAAKRAETASLDWLKLGVVAAASVLVGGVAAAWWYRKTLRSLQQAEEMSPNPQFGIPEDDASEED